MLDANLGANETAAVTSWFTPSCMALPSHAFSGSSCGVGVQNRALARRLPICQNVFMGSELIRSVAVL
jgi:hypothetical protein